MKFKKVEKPNQKLTSFFPRRDSNASGAGPSSSQPSSSSQPTQSGLGLRGPMKSTNQLGQTTQKNNTPPHPDQEIISVSSSSTPKSHISISSGVDSSVVVLSSPPRPKTRAFFIVSPRRSTRVPHPAVAPSSNIALKRSRSPSIQYMGMSQHQQFAATKPSSVASKPRTPTKRKKKFDNDSEVSPNDSVIMIRKSSVAPTLTPSGAPPIPNSRPPAALRSSSVINLTSPCKSSSKWSPKKARFVGREQEQEDEKIEMVPSSQSDEQELAARMIKKDPKDIKESVNRWRHEAASPDPSPLDDDRRMAIDADIPSPEADTPYSTHGEPLNPTSNNATPNSSPLHSSEAEVCLRLFSGANTSTILTTPVSRVFAASSRPKTPPAPSNALLPATPVALSPESKTAQIIAQIKANAMAASVSSPDETSRVLVYKELEESSSSGEEDCNLFKFDKGKGKSVALPTYKDDGPFSSRTGSSTNSGRFSFHDHTLSSSPSSLASSPGPSTSTRLTRTSNRSRPSVRHDQLSLKPVPITANNNNKRKKAAADPLDSLLKEKRSADKRGGMDALRLAEQSMDVKMDDGEEYPEGTGAAAHEASKDNDWMDEVAARKAIAEGSHTPSKSLSPSGSIAGDVNAVEESVVLGEDEAKLLGLKNGGQMKKILESDRAKKGKVKEEKVLGVKLWEDIPRPDNCPILRPEFPQLLVDQHPVFRVLENSWRNRSHLGGVGVLVDSGILASLQPFQYIPLIPFLCESAFSGHDLSSGDSASMLAYLWSGNFPETDNLVSLVLSALIRLGASPVILEGLGWTCLTASNEHVSTDDRVVAIYRLVSLLQMACRAGALNYHDAPDIVMVLLLIAMDPSSSNDLKRDVMTAMDTICQSIKDSGTSSATEQMLCRKTLQFGIQLTPINQAHFISFLSGGCGRTLRIARWLAHRLLVGIGVQSTENYWELPPLSNLIQLLSPAPGSGSVFDIQTNADTIDYEDLGYEVEILGVALSGIDDYAAEEHRVETTAPREDSSESPRRLGKEKPPTQLDMIRTAIDVIHGKIVDTRAAHLDRSRTKAALHRLSMRVYYQRLATSKSGPRGGTRKIREFFAPSS